LFSIFELYSHQHVVRTYRFHCGRLLVLTLLRGIVDSLEDKKTE